MLEVGILKNFDSGTYKAGVQLAGSLTTYFDDISVAKNIPSSALVIGNYVILAIPGGNPRDACVIATWPGGSPGGGMEVHGNEYHDPDFASEAALAAHAALTNPHSATPNATPSRLILRNASGRAKVAAPSASDDIARKQEVDAKPSTFLQLPDTPSSYSGQAGKYPQVNAAENALQFTAGRTLVALATPASIYRHWTSPVSDTPRTATVSSVSGDVITLTANEAYRFWAKPAETDPPNGNMYLKICNTTRAEYAWVKASPANNQLQVTDSGDISGWVNTDVISTAGDGASSKHQELDLSPLIPDGAKGVMVKLQVQDSGAVATLKGSALSAQGVSGTLVWCFMQATDVMNVAYPSSPIQTNRHVFLRDVATGTDTLKVFIAVLGYFI